MILTLNSQHFALVEGENRKNQSKTSEIDYVNYTPIDPFKPLLTPFKTSEPPYPLMPWSETPK